MNDFLKKIIGDKKEWKSMEAGVKALPKDYQLVHKEIMGYIWGSAWLSDEPAALDIFKGLLELFEEGAARGKRVLDITGNDVAAFCDDLLKGEKTYIEKCRADLNRNIAKRLGK